MAAAKRSAKSKRNDAHRALWFKLEIGGVEWSVYLVDVSAFEQEMEDCEAVCLPALAMILVDWDLSPGNDEAAALHEILHAILYSSGMGQRIGHKGSALNDEEEERVVGGITPPLYDTLKRNCMLTIPPRPKTK